MSSDITKNWDYIEDFIRMMHNDKSIWFATTIEVVDYVKALQDLKFSGSDSWVANSSQVPLWIRVNGAEIEIPPAARVNLHETFRTRKLVEKQVAPAPSPVSTASCLIDSV